MKKLSKASLITLLLLAALVTMSVGTTLAQTSTADNFQMTVTVNGLEDGDDAELVLSAKPEATTILEKNIKGNGNRSLTLEISTNLKDGNYQLLLETTSKYFRDPKGYSFKVNESTIVNPREYAIIFDLIPPEAQEFRPYRESEITTGVSNDSLPYMLERIISISGPAKQPASLEETRDAGYHYVGPGTSTDSEGINGPCEVVNPGVRHDLDEGDDEYEFVTNRIYLNKYISGDQHWIEIGWAEVSWEDSARYMYEYDSVDLDWNLFSLPTGSDLQTAITRHTTYTDRWYAQYKASNSNWYYLALKDLDFTTASNAYNRVEVYTFDGNHPSLPSCNTYYNILYIDDDWDWWDSSYGGTTNTVHDDPYAIDYTEEYYNFDIYKD